MNTDVCVCGHLRSAHYADGPCLVAMALGKAGLQPMSTEARGSPRAPQSSSCPCDAFRPSGRRWVPAAERDADVAA